MVKCLRGFVVVVVAVWVFFLSSSALNEFCNTGICCELCHLCKYCQAGVVSLGENRISQSTGSALATTASSLDFIFWQH